MKKTNKILLAIGSISSISALPLIAASCKNKEKEQKEKEQKEKEQKEKEQKEKEQKEKEKKEQIERVTSQVKEIW
ncbi:lipoprotein, partial [Metamycoplasma alkalescens]